MASILFFLMKFIADAMLGRLAKWLRLIGFDTLFFSHIEDSLLLRIAREEQRVILTRDTRMVRAKGITEYLLLTHNNPFKQLVQVITNYDLVSDIKKPWQPGRCSLCNNPLEPVSKDQAKGHVPRYVYQTKEDFTHCSACSKYYWAGSHQEHLREKLSELFPRP